MFINNGIYFLGNLDIKNYINYVYAYPTVPYESDSSDRQLMFMCRYYERYYMDTSILSSHRYDVKWEIDNEEFTVKTNLKFDAMYTDGLLKSSEWKDREKKMGINVRKYLINCYA